MSPTGSSGCPCPTAPHRALLFLLQDLPFQPLLPSLLPSIPAGMQGREGWRQGPGSVKLLVAIFMVGLVQHPHHPRAPGSLQRGCLTPPWQRLGYVDIIWMLFHFICLLKLGLEPGLGNADLQQVPAPGWVSPHWALSGSCTGHVWGDFCALPLFQTLLPFLPAGPRAWPCTRSG